MKIFATKLVLQRTDKPLRSRMPTTSLGEAAYVIYTQCFRNHPLPIMQQANISTKHFKFEPEIYLLHLCIVQLCINKHLCNGEHLPQQINAPPSHEEKASTYLKEKKEIKIIQGFSLTDLTFRGGKILLHSVLTSPSSPSSHRR